MSSVFTRALPFAGSDPRAAALPLMLIAPALFAANMVVARWAEGVGIPPVFLAFGRWALAFLIILPFVAQRLVVERALLLANAPRILLLGGSAWAWRWRRNISVPATPAPPTWR